MVRTQCLISWAYFSMMCVTYLPCAADLNWSCVSNTPKCFILPPSLVSCVFLWSSKLLWFTLCVFVLISVSTDIQPCPAFTCFLSFPPFCILVFLLSVSLWQLIDLPRQFLSVPWCPFLSALLTLFSGPWMIIMFFSFSFSLDLCLVWLGFVLCWTAVWLWPLHASTWHQVSICMWQKYWTTIYAVSSLLLTFSQTLTSFCVCDVVEAQLWLNVVRKYRRKTSP